MDQDQRKLTSVSGMGLTKCDAQDQFQNLQAGKKMIRILAKGSGFLFTGVRYGVGGGQPEQLRNIYFNYSGKGKPQKNLFFVFI